MKKLNRSSWISSAGLFVLILLVAGCAVGKTTLRNLSPVTPAEILPEEVILEEVNAEIFKIRPPTDE